MPRLPSCCQQHSPCGRPSPGHLSLSHSHSSCMQASSSQQTSGSQHSHSHVHSHSNTHHFIHHVHHPAPQPPGTLPFQESSCTVERPTALPATCAGVGSSSNSSSSSNTGHYHDQVGSVLLHITCTGGDVEVFLFFYRMKMCLSLGCVTPTLVSVPGWSYPVIFVLVMTHFSEMFHLISCLQLSLVLLVQWVVMPGGAEIVGILRG